MSSVRMCDKCGNIFSENEEDWSTFTGAVKRRREDGSRYTEQISQDACPVCTGGTQVVTPRVAIGAAPFPAPSGAAPAGHADPLRIQALEHELGMDPLPDVTPGPAGG
jgi:hypothetical protein